MINDSTELMRVCRVVSSLLPLKTPLKKEITRAMEKKFIAMQFADAFPNVLGFRTRSGFYLARVR